METPQNKFVDEVYQLTSETESTFLLANGKLDFHPIVYCSQGFFEDLGHTRNEVCTKDIYLRFMCGKKTNKETLAAFDKGVKNKKMTQVELILYSKAGTKRWYLVTLIPVKDEVGDTTIFLILFNFISHTKGKIPDSPLRLWKIGTRRALNKPSLEYFRKHVDEKKDKERKIKMDVASIKAKINRSFIPTYGLTKPQVPKFLIHHSNIIKVIWDCFILLCILYTSVMVPFLVSFAYTRYEIMIFDTFVDIVFLVDIVITFFTTYINNSGEIVTNPKLIRKNYLRGWFTLDLIAALPYSAFNFFMDNTKSLEILSSFKILRLIRLGKAGKKLGRYMQLSAVTLGVWLLLFALCAHWMACIWYVIAAKFDKPGKTPHSWLAILADVSKSPFNFTANGEIVDGTGPSYASLYISALYYTMSSLTTCGFGNIAPNTSAEKFFGCVTMLMGCVLYALIFGQVTNIISQIQKNSNEFTDQITSIKNFNRIYKMPPNVAKRLEDYFTATWAVTKGTDQREIVDPCPRDLQSDICLNIHKLVFDGNMAFKHLNDSALRALSRRFWTIRTAPGDKLINTGETVDTIYFVATGSLEVFSSNDLTGLIGPHDAWGKSLLDGEDSVHSVYDVKACSFGTIHCISCMDVKEALALYPEEYDKIKYDLVLSINITRQIETVTRTGEIISTEALMSSNDKEKSLARTNSTPYSQQANVYVPGDDITALEHNTNTTHIDVLSGMSELKGELRRETERMNAKMGVVEAQMRLVLKMLRRNNKIALDPEIGLQLNELMEYDEDDDVNDLNEDSEWFVADSHGWKDKPPSTGGSSSSGNFKPRLVKSISITGTNKQSQQSIQNQETPSKTTANATSANTPQKKLHTIVNMKDTVNKTSASKKSPVQIKNPTNSTSKAKPGVNRGYENEETIETILL